MNPSDLFVGMVQFLEHSLALSGFHAVFFAAEGGDNCC